MAIDAFLNTKITGVAQTYNIPPEILRSVVVQESGGNHWDAKTGGVLTGTSGEKGYMQIKPSTAKDLGVNEQDPDENLIGGAKYLAQLKGMFGDWETALQAYNGGMGNVQRGTVSDDAKRYSQSVLKRAGAGAGVTEAPTDIFGRPVADWALEQEAEKKAGKPISAFSAFNLPNMGLFAIGVIVLGVGLAVSVFGAKDRVIKSVVSSI